MFLIKLFKKNWKITILQRLKNVNQIHDAIIKILKNKKLRDALIKNGRKSIEEFNLETFINKLEQLYV